MTRAPDPLKPAGLAEVAAEAGVSVSTVSRALARPQMVSEKTRARIEQAAARIGFSVHPGARNLRLQRTNAVLALVRDLGNAFFCEPLEGIAETLAQAGMDLMIVDVQHHANPLKDLVSLLEPGRCDGAIVLDAPVAGMLADLSAQGTIPPVVVAFEPLQDSALPQVTCDNADGIAQAFAHLRTLGHRHIAHLAGPAGNILSQIRRDIYLHLMRADGLPPQVLQAADFSLTAGQAAATAWLAQDRRATAMICACDPLACGFGWQLQRAGLQIPRDMSLIGFDDLPLALHGPVALTTIRQPRRLVGAKAARLVLSQLDGSSALSRITLPVTLVVRDSTCPPPG